MPLKEFNNKKVKVACVIPPFYRLIESKNNRIFPAMHYLSQILYDNGFEVLLINGDHSEEDYADRKSMSKNVWLLEERYKNSHESFDELLNVIKAFEPQYVFIAAGDVLLPTVEMGSVKSCLKVAKMIKTQISEKVYCVGYGHYLKYSRSPDMKYLDTVCTSDIENKVLDIVNQRCKGKVSESWMTHLDSLPFLSDEYIYYPIQPEDMDYIMSMRGCIGKCKFCLQPGLRNGAVAYMSPKRFTDEIVYRIKKYKLFDFYFADMIFLPHNDDRKKEMFEKLAEIKREYPMFTWRAEARVDSFVGMQDIEQMKKSGCRHLKFGVEMMNQEMLNFMGKGTQVEKVYEVFKWCKQLGISTTAYVLLGCPGFEDKDYKAMWDKFKKLEADNYVVNISVPYMGTKLFEIVTSEIENKGMFKDGEEGLIHLSDQMQKFWEISDQTIELFFSLNYLKEDGLLRKYMNKEVNKNEYFGR